MHIIMLLMALALVATALNNALVRLMQ